MEKFRIIFLTAIFSLIIFTASLYLNAVNQSKAVSLGGAGTQVIERLDILQFRDDKTIQVLEPTSDNYADMMYFSPDDNNDTMLELVGATGGNNITLKPNTDNTNAGINFEAKGTGLFDFIGETDDDLLGLVVNNEADATITTINSPRFYMIGSAYPTGGPAEDVQWTQQVNVIDADTPINEWMLMNNNGDPMLSVDNNGNLNLSSDAVIAANSPSEGPKPVIQLSAVDSGENSIKFTNSVSSSAPSVYADGPEANVDLELGAKGTGIVYSNYPIQTKHSTGFIAGNGLDEDFNLLSMNRASGDETLSWVEADGEFQFSNNLVIEGELVANGAIETTDDVYITTSTAGIILTSPDGTCARGTIDNSDVLTFTSITCP